MKNKAPSWRRRSIRPKVKDLISCDNESPFTERAEALVRYWDRHAEILIKRYGVIAQANQSLRFVVGLVIQASGRTEFEDGLTTGSSGEVLCN